VIRKQTGRFELFLDLLFVAIVANFAEDLAGHASGDQLVKYIVSPIRVFFDSNLIKLV
jgi:low temperature requirement protein LtrA